MKSAYVALLDALMENRAAIEASLDFDQTERRARADALVTGLGENLAAASAPEAACRSLATVTNPNGVSGLPSLYAPPREVVVQCQPPPLQHVLHGLRQAA